MAHVQAYSLLLRRVGVASFAAGVGFDRPVTFSNHTTNTGIILLSAVSVALRYK